MAEKSSRRKIKRRHFSEMAGNESTQYIQDNNIHVILKDAIKELCFQRPDRPYAFLRDYFGRLDLEGENQYELNGPSVRLKSQRIYNVIFILTLVLLDSFLILNL